MTIRPRTRGAATRTDTPDDQVSDPRPAPTRPGSGAPRAGAVTRRCGFTFTTTGRPCANRVADGVVTCRAGHPCGETDGAELSLRALPDGAPAPRPAPTPALRPLGPGRRPDARARRVTDMVRLAMASDDVEHLGLSAEHVLADAGAAVCLLGGPDASPAARATVIQRFGRVGALLVLACEDRWQREQGATAAHLAGLGDEPHGRRLVERLLRDFGRLDARRLYDLLCRIDCGDAVPTHDTPADAHRWLDATYAVAARDGTPAAHRTYMGALERVMRLVRPLVAS